VLAEVRAVNVDEFRTMFLNREQEKADKSL